MNMKRTYIVALIMGLFVTACNDADVIVPGGVEVEHTDGELPVGQMADENVVARVLAHLVGRTALGILVQSDQFLVGEEFMAEIIQFSKVCAQHQRSSPETPQCKVHLVGLITAATDSGHITGTAHTNDQHINIIKATGTTLGEFVILLGKIISERFRAVKNIYSRTIQVCTGTSHPIVGIILSNSTAGEYDIPAGSAQRHGHSHISISAICRAGKMTFVIF